LVGIERKVLLKAMYVKQRPPFGGPPNTSLIYRLEMFVEEE
jgi:hypothetical protein